MLNFLRTLSGLALSLLGSGAVMAIEIPPYKVLSLEAAFEIRKVYVPISAVPLTVTVPIVPLPVFVPAVAVALPLTNVLPSTVPIW